MKYLSPATVVLGLLLIPFTLFSQSNISGKITDASTGEPLAYARILIKETKQGALSDEQGKFSMTVDFGDQSSLTMQVSFLSYSTQTMTITPSTKNLNFAMKSADVFGKEVVITGSRVSETILESPISIQKMTISDIENAASGDFYQSIGNLQGIDMVTSSLGMKVINMRGFNTTSPVRSVQFIDGVDNQAPGLNFPVGNLVGASDLDLLNVEVITGPASALYGPNAFQGVVSMTTKDPYNYQGTSVMLRGGTRNQAEIHARYARAFGPENKIGLKITGSFMRALDWPATDPKANRYGDIETEQNLSYITTQLQFDSTLTAEERDDFIALNNYLDFNPVAQPGILNIQAPGYMEADIADYRTRSIKLGGDLHYKIRDSLEISYHYRLGNGTAVYQGTNRYSIKNIMFQQHRLELQGKNFFVKGYSAQENAGKSYDIVFTAINISKEGVAEYISEYLGEYFSVIDTLTNGFDDDAKQWMVDSAKSRALIAAEQGWYQPGTAAFDSLFNEITTNPDLEKGSQFVDASNFQHIEGGYTLPVKWANWIFGANVRRYDPQSFGTIFEDTLLNPADTLSDGRNDPKADYRQISLWEYGGYTQFQKAFFDQKLRLIGSVRLDKNQNFNLQFSPRLAAVAKFRNHTFRISGQSAFRSPTLQNQYINLNLGPIKLVGNRDGWDNLYTWDSVQEFDSIYDTTFTIQPTLLRTTRLDPLQPEQIRTLEVGYRSVLFEKLYIDATAYFSWYTNFIGNIRVVQPLNGAVAGEESGVNAVLTHTEDVQAYQLYQIPINAKSLVNTYGGSVGLAYYFGRGFSGLFNYTYSGIDTSRVADDDIIPGFNTPEHKFNIGVTGRKVWKNLGFSFNFKWVDGFTWQSSFGDGYVPSFYTMDVMASWDFPKLYSVLRVGGSNLTNNRHIEAYGSPLIGAMGYASWTFDLPRGSKFDFPKKGKRKGEDAVGMMW